MTTTPPTQSELTHRAHKEIDLYLDHYLEQPGIAWNAPDRVAWLLEEVHDVYVALADGDVVATRDHLAHLGAMAVRWLAVVQDGVPR